LPTIDSKTPCNGWTSITFKSIYGSSPTSCTEKEHLTPENGFGLTYSGWNDARMAPLTSLAVWNSCIKTSRTYPRRNEIVRLASYSVLQVFFWAIAVSQPAQGVFLFERDTN
jgi:hypothetical protein